jgi:ABC-2 type transport system ATP-binding protein
MEPFLRTPVRQLSLGQRMRGDFAAAMLHDPKIVYLDEPTIGLDVIAKEAIREFVRHINEERGTTVILTTHDLADVERLSRRIIIIDNGTIIYDGGIERIKEQYGTHRTLILTLTAPHPDPELDGAEIVSNDHGVVSYRFDRRRVRADQLIRQATELYDLRDVTIEEPDLESIIRRIYLEGYMQERV